MEKRERHTIMDGKVVTFAERFEEREGIFGPAHDAKGPYEVSASRNAVIVHSADLRGHASVKAFVEAVEAAAEEAFKMASEDRGNYGWRG